MPDYVNGPNTWVSYDASGAENKRADLFYAHPTTAAGLIRWNITWNDMGDICTGPSQVIQISSRVKAQLGVKNQPCSPMLQSIDNRAFLQWG